MITKRTASQIRAKQKYLLQMKKEQAIKEALTTKEKWLLKIIWELQMSTSISTMDLLAIVLNIHEIIFINDRAHRIHTSSLKMKLLLLIGPCKISII